MQTEGKLKKKHEDQVLWVRTRTRNFFPKFSNSHQNAFPSLSQTLHYQPRVLEVPILFPQGPERIVIVCILPLRVGHFELCLRDEVWDRPTLNFLVFIDKFCVQRLKRRVS